MGRGAGAEDPRPAYPGGIGDVLVAVQHQVDPSCVEDLEKVICIREFFHHQEIHAACDSVEVVGLEFPGSGHVGDVMMEGHDLEALPDGRRCKNLRQAVELGPVDGAAGVADRVVSGAVEPDEAHLRLEKTHEGEEVCLGAGDSFWEGFRNENPFEVEVKLLLRRHACRPPHFPVLDVDVMVARNDGDPGSSSELGHQVRTGLELARVGRVRQVARDRCVLHAHPPHVLDERLPELRTVLPDVEDPPEPDELAREEDRQGKCHPDGDGEGGRVEDRSRTPCQPAEDLSLSARIRQDRPDERREGCRNAGDEKKIPEEARRVRAIVADMNVRQVG